jgi:hypothetical protein
MTVSADGEATSFSPLPDVKLKTFDSKAKDFFM